MLVRQSQPQDFVHATSTAVFVGDQPRTPRDSDPYTKVARRPLLTFFEAEGVALVEQHGVEQQSAVLADRDGSAAHVAILPQKVSYAVRIPVEL